MQRRCFYYEECTVEAKMMAIKVFLSSLGKRLDCIRDIILEKLGNGLVGKGSKASSQRLGSWLVSLREYNQLNKSLSLGNQCLPHLFPCSVAATWVQASLTGSKVWAWHHAS